MKNKLILILLIFSLFAHGDLFAEAEEIIWESGKLDGKFTDDSNPSITDKNFSTFYELGAGKTVSFSLNNPAFVREFRLLSEAPVTVYFYEISNPKYPSNVKHDGSINSLDGSIYITYRDAVDKIVLKNNTTSSIKIYEFEVYPIDPPEEGLLSGKEINIFDSNEIVHKTSYVTDRNTSTVNYTESFDKNQYFFYEFPSPTVLNGFKALTNNTSVFAMKTYDEEGNLIETVTSINENPYQIGTVENIGIPIKKIEFSKLTGGGFLLYEFEVYGEELPPSPIVEEIEVSELKVETSYNRVDLSWKLPQLENFHHINIYRKTISQEQTAIESFFFGTKAYASDEMRKIFETNGTYFNDLTVSPDTKYEYKLTTTTNDNEESTGVNIEVVTLPEPEPQIEGGGYTEDENGDFLFTWTSPTTGTVKVLIDGVEYTTVVASVKQVLIPKEDMKFDIFGNPKVSLVPISETGKIGQPTKPKNDGKIGGVQMPFGATDLLRSSFNLLGVLAPIILLTLAFYFFKPIKNLIVQAVQKRNERRM